MYLNVSIKFVEEPSYQKVSKEEQDISFHTIVKDQKILLNPIEFNHFL
jgi:hypothetical protein